VTITETGTLTQVLLTLTIGLPGLVSLWLALVSWFDLPKSEASTATLVNGAFALTALSGAALWGLTLVAPPTVPLLALPWFNVERYHFELLFIVDWISAPLSTLFAILGVTIGVFSRRYLHREPGYHRFYLLLALFVFSVQLTVLSGSLDGVFIGWELVGLCSALLIAYFHRRRKPVEHALRALFTYRFCDIGLLSAVVWVHHTVATTSFTPSVQTGVVGLPFLPTSAALVGLLLLIAAIGKGGQLPLGGWLPRAMEGPTPSSAIFYGAISIHLAPFLLLRSAPVIAESFVATVAVIGVGALTALYGTFVGRVQSDVKSALAYASMCQVGLMFIEIGLGWYTLALWHLMGHACVRSLQILTSPDLLRNIQMREQEFASPIPRTGAHLERLVPKAWQPWLYRFALEGGYLDVLLFRFVLDPLTRVLRWLDTTEQLFTDRLEGVSPTANQRDAKLPEPKMSTTGVR
jgi:NADH-quinone oxidoreductase subunit L